MALTLAIPSKGRLKEACDAWFSGAGLKLELTAGVRGYRGAFSGLPGVDVMLLSAGEIASSLAAGDIHMGVSGEDLLREAAPDLEGRMHLVCPMGFGFADVVVAVSEYWIDVSTMADLDDVCAAYARTHHKRLRVATKYAQLTRGFFAHNGIADYRIVPSAGATEAAPAAGTAEVIVDITTTGSTLKANGLKVLDDGVILKSQAQLAASLSAEWDSQTRATGEILLTKLSAAAGSALYPALAQRLK